MHKKGKGKMNSGRAGAFCALGMAVCAQAVAVPSDSGADVSEEVAFQHAFIRNLGLAPDEEEEVWARNAHPDAQWYPTACLGLFIHWGISSVTGWGDLSWGMIKPAPGQPKECLERWGLPSPARNVPPNEYWRQAERFDASRFDPDRILAAAKRAGFTYAILTAKHHDGFCLWPSSVGGFSTGNWLGGRDLVGEFVAACRRQGLKVGLYYSPPDWRFDRDYMTFSRDPGDPDVGCDWEPRKPLEMTDGQRARLREYNRIQIEELLTRYGKIDMMWFDGMGSTCISVKRMRELQPSLIINDRGRSHGDFLTQDSECRFPRSRRPMSLWWEYIHTLCDGGWGWRYHESYKPLAWLVAQAAMARSWNGNFVANVAPDGHGALPEAYYKLMEGMAAWMRENGRSIVGTRGTDLWPERCNVPVTRRDDTLYFHYDWLQCGEIACEGVAEPLSAEARGRPVPYEWKGGRLRIRLPYDRVDNLTTVVEVRLRGDGD